jgi:UDP-GlcNAc3NAcA epimerase
MKVLLVVGTRPQVIKLASLTRALDEAGVDFSIVHTGQHYDYDMDEVFFKELKLPEPIEELDVGSGTHGYQTGEMLIKLEKALEDLRPRLVVVPGDTNSALAGGLAAVKLGIPAAHVEAGLRSHLPFMAEEINRVLLDHMSQLLFAPTSAALDNLKKEGLGKKATKPGDVMADNIKLFQSRLGNVSLPPGVARGRYAYVTVHRAETVEDEKSLGKMVSILNSTAKEFDMTLAFAVHPHTRRRLEETGLMSELRSDKVLLLGPVSYLTSLRLTKEASFVMTDSGGLQKEAFLLGTPCVTLRRVTEWTETVRSGWNSLTGLEEAEVKRAIRRYVASKPRRIDAFRFYGGGGASRRIAGSIQRFVRHGGPVAGPSERA